MCSGRLIALVLAGCKRSMGMAYVGRLARPAAWRFDIEGEIGMRCAAWSRTMLGLAVLTGALVVATPPALSQMCTTPIKDCEGQADAEAKRCLVQCTRYDTICADRCDDTLDIVVRYCRIKAALCKAAEGQSYVQGYVKASASEHQ